MRIFDRIASGESVYEWGADARVTGDMTVSARSVAHRATRIVADEAAHYGARFMDREMHLHQDAYGPIMPTFPLMWIEWRESSDVITGSAPSGVFTAESVAVIVQGERKGDGYELRVGPSFLYRKGSPIGVAMQGIRIQVDRYGRHVGAWRTQKADAVMARDGDYWSGMSPAFQTLGWMNCKNLSVVKHQVSHKRARARAKRGQFAGLDYHTVEIPGGGSGGTADGVALGTRLHMVRGHFAVYTPDAPMFGKYVGAYWKPSHLRGDAELGCITSEYHVQEASA